MKYVNNLKDLRKKAGFTQDELAKEIGISKRTLAYWEKGENNIKPEKAERLAKIFNVSVAYLLGYTDDSKVYDDEQVLEISGDVIATSKKKWLEEYGDKLLTNFVRFLIDNNYCLSNTEIVNILNFISALSVGSVGQDKFKREIFADIGSNPDHEYYELRNEEYSFILGDEFARDETEEAIHYYIWSETRSKIKAERLREVLENAYGKPSYERTPTDND
ncbi:helix-turn-helix domain-containing protein [Streptococcus alactolyticus]|uniref:helix-turn-helix domain-containing protein n=1 Tax=Streptococcus alactolyticus TaxID=29389 RepID=UPI003CFEB7E1